MKCPLCGSKRGVTALDGRLPGPNVGMTCIRCGCRARGRLFGMKRPWAPRGRALMSDGEMIQLYGEMP